MEGPGRCYLVLLVGTLALQMVLGGSRSVGFKRHINKFGQ